MKIRYERWTPGPATFELLEAAEDICEEYAAAGYDLTLRQLYYQFVARDIIPNTQRDYKRLGEVINKGRLAGFLDWDYIVDRTRNLEHVSHWDNPGDIMRSAAASFRLDKWENQPVRVEVWVEKEALAGVIERAADRSDVAWFSCRGYVSQSELWRAAQRHATYLAAGQDVVVLHLGDHDPSGIDMTRDIQARLDKFVMGDTLRDALRSWVADGGDPDDVDAQRDYLQTLDVPRVDVRRIALNYDQVEAYQPPPNPAKMTDSRAADYVAEHGRQSWELDALPPDVLDQLIQDGIDSVVDEDAYRELKSLENEHRSLLEAASARWEDVKVYLNGGT